MRSTISSVEISIPNPSGFDKEEAKEWDVTQIGTMNCPKIPSNVATIAGVARLMLTSSI
jgi:hypothetical protein